MDSPSRLDDLRRRVRQDPASIAFAQLAEECRRAGLHAEAVETCRSGLALHPGYVSARITLARALVQLGELDQARTHLYRVLEESPSNPAAIRGLADIHRRQGLFAEALAHYREALILAPDDPELERTIAEVSDALLRSVEARARDRADRTICTLEGWLTALHVLRDERHA